MLWLYKEKEYQYLIELTKLEGKSKSICLPNQWMLYIGKKREGETRTIGNSKTDEDK